MLSILLLHSLIIGKTVSSIQGGMGLGTRLTGGLRTRTSIKRTPLIERTLPRGCPLNRGLTVYILYLLFPHCLLYTARNIYYYHLFHKHQCDTEFLATETESYFNTRKNTIFSRVKISFQLSKVKINSQFRLSVLIIYMDAWKYDIYFSC